MGRDTEMVSKSLKTGLLRGLSLRCPTCGKGRLFRSFLKVQSDCPVCHTDNTVYPSDDAPPYITLLLTGHIIVPLYMWIEHDYSPALWLQAAIWLPLTVIMAVGLLPYMKGGVIGICWAQDIRRE